MDRRCLHSLVFPVSQPYCVSRNLAFHAAQPPSHTGSSSSVLSLNQRAGIAKKAKSQSLTFLDRIGDYHVPADLLQDTIVAEMELEKINPTRRHRNASTMLTVNHNDATLLVHAGGHGMDELTVRNANYGHHAQNTWLYEPGYSVNVGQGSSIRQVVSAGSSHFGSTANVLATTVGEVFHYQTVDSFPQKSRYDDTESTLCPILLPKGKWQLPYEILTAASFESDSSSINQVLFLTRNGAVFSWTPTVGVRCEVVSLTQACSAEVGMENFNLDSVHCLEVTKHPKLAFMSQDQSLFTLDLRSRHLNARCEIDHPITAVKQHGRYPHQYVMSADRHMYLMDARFERTYVSRKIVSTPCNHISYKHFRDVSPNESIGKD